MFKNCGKSIKYAFEYAPKEALSVLIISLISATFFPLQLFLIQNLVDSVNSYMFGNIAIESLYLYAGGLAVLFIFSSASKTINSYLLISFERKLDVVFTGRIIKKFAKIKYRYFEDSSFQNTLQRMKDNPDKKIYSLYVSLVEVLKSFIQIIGVFVIIAVSSWICAVLYLIVLIFVATMDFIAMNKMNIMFNNLSSDERRIEYINSLLTNKDSLYEIVLYNAQNFFLNEYSDLNKKVLGTRLKNTLKSQKYSFFSNLGIVIWISSLIFFLLSSIKNNTLTVGAFIALVGSFQSILSITESFSYEISVFAQNGFILEHISAFFDFEEEFDLSGEPVPAATVNSIEFKNVWFKYPGTYQYALKNVSFTVNGADNIALVGRNGAGKSTVIKLVCKLYEPDKGEIFINGKNTAFMDRNEICSYFSVVFQDFGRYGIRVNENVALDNMNEVNNDRKIREALKQVNAEADFPDLIQELGKYDKNGVDLSIGQWQKLAVARALFSDKNYVIMDEPTASMDPNAESVFYANMRNLFASCGCIFVSHRMASAKMSDKIIVIDDGEIVEEGNHDTLMKAKGFYSNMFNSQISVYKTEEKLGNGNI